MKRLLEETPRSKIKTFYKQNKWVCIGVLGAVLAFLGGAGINAVSAPWLTAADAPFHLDYAWQVYQGELPQFHDGIAHPDFSDTRFHRSSQHPPLYYVILAPVVGPFIASGDWNMAVAVGRFLTLSIGVLSLLALAWVGWVVGGRYRKMLAVAAPSLGASFLPFVEFVSAIYSDSLLVLLSTTAFALAALMLYRGPRWSLLLPLAAVLLLGMATRVAFASMFGVGLSAVVISFAIHGKDSSSKNVLKGLGYAAAIGLVAVLGIGWFYYFHNLQGGSSLITDQPESFEPIRRYKPFTQVITSEYLWYLIPFHLFGQSARYIAEYTVNQWVSYLVFFLGVSGSVIWLTKRKLRASFDHVNKANLLVGVMLVAYLGLVFAQQIVYATGYGMFNPRYILPAWVALGIILAFGLLTWRLRGLVVVAAVTAGWLAVINWIVRTLMISTNLPEDQGWLYLLQSGAVQNGFPSLMVPLLLGVIVAGIALTGVSLRRLSSPDVSQNTQPSDRIPF